MAAPGLRPGLLKATFTLLAGGALAQALPLLLGPWLTRLYRPDEFGVYHLFAAVAANVAVVACARYEFALPLARDETEASALRGLSLALLAGVTLLCGLGGVGWAAATGTSWPLWLPLAVAALGAVSLATLEATRTQRIGALASARVLQHGGGALAQVGAGLLQWGVAGLIAAPIAACLAAVALLRLRVQGLGDVTRAQVRAVARRHRDFPLLNTPHAFLGALIDTLALVLVTAALGVAAAGFWGLTLRYLKAPATLVGTAVSQALYPRLVPQQTDDAAPGAAQATGAAAGFATLAARAAVVRVMALLGLVAAPGVLGLLLAGPQVFEWLFGAPWREAGALAQALAPYIGVHFVASPLAVCTMAWGAQAWALQRALVGQAMFIAALAAGLYAGSLVAAGWAVSAATVLYFGWYFYKLATWPISDPKIDPN